MTRKERYRWNILLKRRDWLEARIGDGERDNRDLSYDKRELSALKWIMDEYLVLKLAFVLGDKPKEPR